MKPSSPLTPADALLSVVTNVGNALSEVEDVDRWEHEKSEKELQDIRKEIAYLTPAPNTLDGSLLIKPNSKESEVLRGRISAAQQNHSTSKKADK